MIGRENISCGCLGTAVNCRHPVPGLAPRFLFRRAEPFPALLVALPQIQKHSSTREASMLREIKLLAFLACAVAPWFLMTVGTTSAADETFTVKQIISLPNGQSVGSFDIGFDDANIHTFAFADRTNKSVDLIDTNTNKVVKQLTANFAGVRANPGQASGPDGVLIVDQKEVWAGDAPSSCLTVAPFTCTHDSSIKVIDIKSGSTVAVLNTGGQRRADELCEDVGHE